MRAVSPSRRSEVSHEIKESLAEKYSFRQEKIRIALRVHLDHGVKSLVARDSGIRMNFLSKILGSGGGDGKPIHVPEILVEVGLFHLRGTCGHRALSDAIQLLRDGAIDDFKEHECRAHVIEYPGVRKVVEFE
jgi:hypothetical protein